MINNAYERYKINPRAVFSDYNMKGDSRVLCTISNQEGQLKQFSLSNDVREFLMMFDGVNNFRNISELSGKYSCEQINKIADNFLIPNKIIVESNSVVTDFNFSSVKPEYMTFKKEVLSFSKVNFISRFFCFLFKLPIFCTMLSVSVFSLFFYIYHVLFVGDYVINSASSIDVIVTVFLIFIGLAFHEIGHATAAYKYGCRTVSIGVGGYACFLVFYADLTECWKLERKYKVIVDLSGSYFQGLVSFSYLVVYFFTEEETFFNAFILLNIYTIYNANPFFRMDGYWVVSDLFRIDNLRGKSGRFVSDFLKKPISMFHVFFKSEDREFRIVFIYSFLLILFNFIFIYFLTVEIFPSLSYSILYNLEYIYNKVYYLGFLDVIVKLFSIFWNVVIECFILFFYYRIAKSLLVMFKTNFIRNVKNAERTSN